MIKPKKEVKKNTYKAIEKRFKDVFLDIEDSIEVCSELGEFETSLTYIDLEFKELQCIADILDEKGYYTNVSEHVLKIGWR